MAKFRKRPTVKLKTLDKRVKVGTQGFKGQPANKKWLMAWRRAHMFGGHGSVRKFARAKKKKPSSRLGTAELVRFIRLQESTGGRFFRS